MSYVVSHIILGNHIALHMFYSTNQTYIATRKVLASCTSLLESGLSSNTIVSPIHGIFRLAYTLQMKTTRIFKEFLREALRNPCMSPGEEGWASSPFASACACSRCSMLGSCMEGSFVWVSGLRRCICRIPQIAGWRLPWSCGVSHAFPFLRRYCSAGKSGKHKNSKWQ